MNGKAKGALALQRVLRGRIPFIPVGKGYTFAAPTGFDKLFSGVVVPRSVWAAGNRNLLE
jgi:hypothetical protein